LVGSHKQADAGKKETGSYRELAGVPEIVGVSKEADGACHGQAEADDDWRLMFHLTVSNA